MQVNGALLDIFDFLVYFSELLSHFSLGFLISASLSLSLHLSHPVSPSLSSSVSFISFSQFFFCHSFIFSLLYSLMAMIFALPVFQKLSLFLYSPVLFSIALFHSFFFFYHFNLSPSPSFFIFPRFTSHFLSTSHLGKKKWKLNIKREISSIIKANFVSCTYGKRTKQISRLK